MLYLKSGQTNNMVVSVSQNKTLSSPRYVFVFTHILSNEVVEVQPQDVSSARNRYDEFQMTITCPGNDKVLPPQVCFPYLGQYYYVVYETTANTKVSVVEEGRALLTTDVSTLDEYYTTIESDNDNNTNYILQ